MSAQSFLLDALFVNARVGRSRPDATRWTCRHGVGVDGHRRQPTPSLLRLARRHRVVPRRRRLPRRVRQLFTLDSRLRWWRLCDALFLRALVYRSRIRYGRCAGFRRALLAVRDRCGVGRRLATSRVLCPQMSVRRRSRTGLRTGFRVLPTSLFDLRLDVACEVGRRCGSLWFGDELWLTGWYGDGLAGPRPRSARGRGHSLGCLLTMRIRLLLQYRGVVDRTDAADVVEIRTALQRRTHHHHFRLADGNVGRSVDVLRSSVDSTDLPLDGVLRVDSRAGRHDIGWMCLVRGAGKHTSAVGSDVARLGRHHSDAARWSSATDAASRHPVLLNALDRRRNVDDRRQVGYGRPVRARRARRRRLALLAPGVLVVDRLRRRVGERARRYPADGGATVWQRRLRRERLIQRSSGVEFQRRDAEPREMRRVAGDGRGVAGHVEHARIVGVLRSRSCRLAAGRRHQAVDVGSGRLRRQNRPNATSTCGFPGRRSGRRCHDDVEVELPAVVQPDLVFFHLEFVQWTRPVDVRRLRETFGRRDGRRDGARRTVAVMPHPWRTARRTLRTASWRTLWRRGRWGRIHRRSLVVVSGAVYSSTIQRWRFHLLRRVFTYVQLTFISLWSINILGLIYIAIQQV